MRYFLVLLFTFILTACDSSSGPSNPGPTPDPVVPNANCANPAGGIIKHGEAASFYKDSEVAFGQSCQSETRQCANGVLSGSFVNSSCVVMPEGEPSSHEKPMKLSDEGLKMGGVKLIGTQWVISSQSRLFSPPPPVRPACATEPLMGSICAQGTPICTFGDRDYSCEPKKSYKVWGWIYDKRGLDHSNMAEGVSVDIYSFAFCLSDSRGCGPFAGPVKTDKWGYFELTTGTLFDTLRINGLPKYYAFCNRGAPIAGGGQYLADTEGKAIGPFKQMLVKEDTCKEQGLMKSADQSMGKNTVLNPNLEPIK